MRDLVLDGLGLEEHGGGERQTLAHEATPRTPVLDRHDDFASTVPLETSFLGRVLPPVEGHYQHMRSSASLRSARSQQSGSCRVGPNRSTKTLTSSVHSARSGRSCGVPVRPWMLPRQDAIPCRNTGKRSAAAQDGRIRIFVRLPSGGRVAFWVEPDMPIGPPQRTKHDDPFEQIFGEDAEERGPMSGVKGAGRHTPLRELLAGRRHLCESADVPMLLSSGSDFDWSHLDPAEESLKSLVEAATGVSIAQQKLIFGRAGKLDDHSRAICDYDIGHGALLYLSIRPEQGKKKETKYLSGPALAGIHEPGFIQDKVLQFTQGRVGSKMGKDIAEPLPDWVDPPKKAPDPPVEPHHENPYFNYGSVLHDNHIFDLANRVRSQFKALPRKAEAHAAPKRMSLLPVPPTSPRGGRSPRKKTTKFMSHTNTSGFGL